MSGRAYWVLAACILAAALALRWQCLHTGFMVDDYLQLAIVRGVYPVERSAIQLYTFATGDVAQNDALRRAGLLTWWSHPALHISMFRPLTCALFWLDHALFGLDAFRYHLHSAAWWLVMGGALAALLRRVLPGWVALLALALFAVDDAHIPLLNWITNRNASVASAFALLGLLAQVRERQDGWRPGPRFALGAHALGLAAAEYALPFLGYALLYELQQPLPRAQRVRRLALPVLLLCVYFVCRFLFGAGTSGSGMYHSLFAPLEFARDGFVRFTLLISDLAFGLPATYWTFGVPWPPQLVSSGVIPMAWVVDLTAPRLLHSAAAVVLAVAALFIGRAALRAARAHAVHGASWLILGAPLALVPVLSACAETRLAVPALVGCSVIPPLLLHARLRELRDRDGTGPGSRLAVAAAALFVLFHLLVPIRAQRDAEMAVAVARAARNGLLDPALDRLLAPDKRVLLLGAADPTTSIYGGLVREIHGRSVPAEWQMLSSTLLPQKLERLSATSFALERLHPGYTAGDAYAEFFTDRPLHDGAQFRVGNLAVTVERAHHGRPLRTRYELGAPLEHASFVFLTQTRRGLRPLTLPPIGQSSIVEPPFPAFDVQQ